MPAKAGIPLHFDHWGWTRIPHFGTVRLPKWGWCVTVEEFIEKWEHCPGSERANYAVFLTELAGVLGVDAPGPKPDYQIDAPVPGGAAGGGTGFIDLYKRGCFILEAKQSKICELPTLPGLADDAPEPKGQKYDELMRRAFRQARRYAQSLPEPPWPPFIIVLDVGRAFEIYFDYAGNGRDYRFFPDRSSYRIPIASLRDPAIQARLRAIWDDPKSLDPALVTAEVTRDIAKRLGSVSAWLEETQRLKTGASAADWEHSAALEETSLFLMRILFCMFAEDAQLLSDDPNERPFKAFLKKTLDDDGTFSRGLADLWQKMGQANLDDRWTFAFEHPVKYFNGSLFADTKVYELARAERGELIAAAEHEWKNVEPAIFGTLLEQALTKNQRSQLGAHYTPRPYVERIVEATITDVLRSEWEAVETALEGLEPTERLERLQTFHDRLANIVVLDPACGTGNFLYVSMEALLGIESKVLQAIEDTGGVAQSRIGPGQLHGLEKNPRAAKIAELVLWIGWLRWRLKNGAGEIEEPVLAQKANINFGRPGGYDAVLAQDELGQPILDNPRQPEWPEADFIVGNPPFIGGSDMRQELGSDYAEAVWNANLGVGGSADFVMQWWDRAASLALQNGTRLIRFGFVTTNSITQVFSRRVIEKYLRITSAHSEPDNKLSIIYAIPDHPWLKRRRDQPRSKKGIKKDDPAAVRIAMTVAERGNSEGRLVTTTREAGLDTDIPIIDYSPPNQGVINPDLTVGSDITAVKPLDANKGMSFRGVTLIGKAFAVTRQQALALGVEKREGLRERIVPYLNGNDLTKRPRNLEVVDFFGLEEAEVRQRYPEAYQYLYDNVFKKRWNPKANKGVGAWEGREVNNRPAYKNFWWIFGEPRGEQRPSLLGLSRYIVTVQTSKHRIFQFVGGEVLPDQQLIVFPSDDAFLLGVLSSNIHLRWKEGVPGSLEDRPRYNNTQVFDPFPFPDATEEQRATIAELAEELNATRKAALAEVPGLTMTEIYNLREMLRSGEPMSPADQQRATAARAGIVNRLHEQLDEAVAAAFGWPADLPPSEIVARLVALNAERAAEEADGQIRWLRPDYQEPKFGKKKAGAQNGD